MTNTATRKVKGKDIKDSPKSNRPNSNKDDGVAAEQKNTAARLRGPIFIFPPIPRWESILYWIVSLSLRAYGFYAVYTASCQYYASKHRYNHSLRPSTWIPEALTKYTPGGNLRDYSNWEWNHWSSYWLFKVLPWYAGHAVIFNLGQKVLPTKYFDDICLIFWFTAAVLTTSPKLVLFILAEIVLVFTLARLTRSILVIWGACAVYLYLYTGAYVQLATFVGGFGVENPLAEIMFYTYKQLHILSFAIEMVKKSKLDWNSYTKDLYKLVHYAFYLPYTCSVVRIYPYFEKEIRERSTKPRNLKSAIFFGCRVFFWVGFTETFLHFFFTEAIITNAQFLRTISIDQLIAIGYASLHFFHLKYVGIFGFGQFFAKMDNMVPTDLPMCPGHVSMYSKTWRLFDVGLYDFFKNYIFIPIAAPSFSLFWKLIGFCVCYLFVLLWHGFEHNYVVWILLSMMEIWSEIASKGIYLKFLRKWREANVSDRSFRAILAVLHLWTGAVGCYASFYFLGGAQSGWAYADRVFWQLTLPPRWQVWLMFVYGYFFNQVGFDVTVYFHEKAVKKAQKQE